MEAARYAIATQSALWVISLEVGPAHEKHDEHLFFRGSNPEEVWGYLCRYLDDIYEKTTDPREKGYCIKTIVLASDDHRDDVYVKEPGGYVVRTCVGISQRYMVRNADLGSKDPWDHEDGPAALVRIKRMDLIEFRK